MSLPKNLRNYSRIIRINKTIKRLVQQHGEGDFFKCPMSVVNQIDNLMEKRRSLTFNEKGQYIY